MPTDTSPFRPLDTLDAWRDAQEQSATGPVLIYKHSSICPTSARAEKQMRQVAEEHNVPVYRVVVQESRDVSDRIAEDTGVRHESPQLLILQDGDAVFDASHHRVKADRVREQLVSS
jgi:bacillithiol system protein YtxJ